MDRALSSRERRARGLKLVGKALLVTALLAALGWSGQYYLRPSLDRASLRIATVERGPIEAIVSASGRVVPAVERTLASPVRAEIREVRIALGERVERGQVLIRLDATAAELELGSLEERLALKDAELRSRELQLADVIRDARSRRELLAVDLEGREVRHGRLERLAETGLVSADQLLEAELDLKRTRIELEQVEAQIASLEARREADLEQLRLERSMLDQQRADQARRLASTSVTAPAAGIVTYFQGQAGVSVAEGETLATIAVEGSYRVEAQVADFYAARLEPGHPVRVRSSFGETGGRLARIVPVPAEARLYLFVDLDDPSDSALRANLRVDVDVVTARRPDALQVRRGPAVESAGVQEVFIVQDDRAVRRSVRLGMSSRQMIEILEGLEPGEEVIISDVTRYAGLSQIRIL